MQKDHPSFKRFSRDDVKGVLREEILNLLPDAFFKDPISSIQKMNGEVIEKSKLRFAAIFTLPNGRRIFLKRDLTKGWLESLKYVFLPTKARKEWFIAYQSQKRSLNIPQPFGWMEKVHRGFVKESYYLSEAMGLGVSLIEDLLVLRESSWINELAKMVRKIHDAGLFHKDLHAGNFLRNGQSLFLIDLHRANIIRALSLNQRLWNLSQLFHSLRTIWQESDRLRFIEKYFEGDPLNFQKKRELIQNIHSFMDRFQERQWRSRTKRCLAESTEFSVERERGTTYYHRRDFPLDILKEMAKEHLQFTSKKPSDLLKFSPETTVSLLGEWGKKIGVKHYHPTKIWDRVKEHFRRSKGMRAWIAGNGLKARGIPTLNPLGLAEERDWLGLKESFFFMEVLEGAQELDRYIVNHLENLKGRRLFTKVFAQWLSHYHDKDLYHRDMKSCNILVSKNGETWNFHLLDLEDVRLNKKVSERDLFKSFLQLNTSAPKIITTTDRFRFFKEYLNLNPIIKNQKVFLRRLIEESRRRGLVYVSPKGVVIEKI